MALHTHANINFECTIQELKNEGSKSLLVKICSWVKTNKPLCLLHPHGFYVICLKQLDGMEWRFHYWAKRSRFITGMPATIHTHNTIIESRILIGKLYNIDYEIQPTVFGGHPIYEVAYEGSKYLEKTSNILYKTDRRAIPNIIKTRELINGDYYKIPQNCYHEVIVPDDIETATLVCQHSKSKTAPQVLGLDGFPEAITFKRQKHSIIEDILDFSDLLAIK